MPPTHRAWVACRVKTMPATDPLNLRPLIVAASLPIGPHLSALGIAILTELCLPYTPLPLTDCRKDTGDYNAFGFGNLVLTTVGSFVDAEERIYNCGIYYSLQW